ncbi:hypothetical protein BC835DRAFT_1418180 [Cytidiella melzeri]|nr:hypothetical protein BC835DRAFT_1418180 [Cytidiella melzeri]
MASHDDSHEVPTVAGLEESYCKLEAKALRLAFQEPMTQHIQTVPLEIMLAIFTLSVVSENHAFVTMLAQVCHSWRQAVVSLPILWSTLSLSLKKPREKAMLWRSRNQGLLRGLHIRDNGKEVMAALKIFINVALDSLRFLSVGGMTYQALRSILPQLTPAVISNLESLDLRHTDHRWFANTSSLHLHSLVAEELHDRAVPDILWLLHRNPMLESFSLECKGWSLAGELPSPSFIPRLLPPCIVLHKLTKLRLAGGEILARLLLPLFLPGLRSLELYDLRAGVGPIVQALTGNGVVTRLASIAIVYRHSDRVTSAECTESLIALLRDATSLKCLELVGFVDAKGVVEAITQNPQALCPQLATLDLSQCLDVTDQMLLTLVEARNDSSSTANSSDVAVPPVPVAKLHTLVIKSCDEVTDSGLTWLKENVPHLICHPYRISRRTRAGNGILGLLNDGAAAPLSQPVVRDSPIERLGASYMERSPLQMERPLEALVGGPGTSPTHELTKGGSSSSDDAAQVAQLKEL